MSAIIDMFKWIWNGLTEMFQWLTSAPAVLVSACTGFYFSFRSFLGAFTDDSNHITEAVEYCATPLQAIAEIINRMPDIVKLGFYATSIDVLFQFLSAAFFLFVAGFVAVIEFQLVTVLGFFAVVYGTKLVAWFINSVFPSSWVPYGLKSIANINMPKLEMKLF